MSDWKELRKKLLEDDEFRTYCESKQVDLDVANALVRMRMENHLTQAELAKMAGVTKKDVDRYENLDELPSLATLNQLAKALGYSLKLEFVRNQPLKQEE